MSNEKNNNVPVMVQQMAYNLLDKSSPSHVRFNTAQSIRAVRDYCDRALKEYDKTVIWDNKTGKK